MLRYGISVRLQVISFNRVSTDELQESIHGIRQQNPTWGSFEEALREAYDYERPKGWGRGEFEQWVASAKIHQRERQSFLEFERHFVQFLEHEQRFVGVDKVLIFVRSINRIKGWPTIEDEWCGQYEDRSTTCRYHGRECGAIHLLFLRKNEDQG